MKKLLSLVLCLTLCLLCVATASAAYTAGTYTGVATGIGGDITVAVTFSDSAITAVEIKSHSETPGISDPAIARIPEAIVASQSLGVDTITGCTVTSKGIIEAVADAATLAGADVDALRAVEVAKAEAGDTIEKTVDVVVVGAGGASIAAASAAVENGATVLVLEKTAAAGGNTLASGLAMNAADP